MQHVQVVPPFRATCPMQPPGTGTVSITGHKNNRCVLTSPSDFIANVQVPIKRRITKPPNTVLISGIPLCFAYKANSLTKTLAHIANSTFKLYQQRFKRYGKILAENVMKKKYSINHLPPVELMCRARLQGIQSRHCANSSYP